MSLYINYRQKSVADLTKIQFKDPNEDISTGWEEADGFQWNRKPQ